ncbi:MAG: hypothetical protein INR65_05120 [Gluconacetobacter diazotrophicus]|nr:hypothetical protein [Gluconacetobacter diazotrophicus]
MSQTSTTPNEKLVTELKVSAHLMMLDPGLFCIFHTPGVQPPDPGTGLPGVRITRPPAVGTDALEVSTFNPDGWLGGSNNAALVRVVGRPTQVLVSIYQEANSTHEAPKLQVLRLSDAGGGAVAQPPQQQPPRVAVEAAPGGAGGAGTPVKAEVAAHIQRRGDVLARLGDWMGVPGSQNWIEGFAIAPDALVTPADIEYQAVLGKGWLSPWAEGGNYCGSRGMALPILGLRVRLKGEAAEDNRIRVTASFTDGSRVGPVDGSQTAEAESLAPLEAFLVEIVPAGSAAEPDLAAADVEDAEIAPPPVAAVAKASKPLPPGRPAPAARPMPRTPMVSPKKGRR